MFVLLHCFSVSIHTRCKKHPRFLHGIRDIGSFLSLFRCFHHSGHNHRFMPPPLIPVQPYFPRKLSIPLGLFLKHGVLPPTKYTTTHHPVTLPESTHQHTDSTPRFFASNLCDHETLTAASILSGISTVNSRNSCLHRALAIY